MPQSSHLKGRLTLRATEVVARRVADRRDVPTRLANHLLDDNRRPNLDALSTGEICRHLSFGLCPQGGLGDSRLRVASGSAHLSSCAAGNWKSREWGFLPVVTQSLRDAINSSRASQ